MASLSTGSVNFPTSVYENSAALVDDLATKMLDSTASSRRSRSSTSRISMAPAASSTSGLIE